jgi:hypothetical protein
VGDRQGAGAAVVITAQLGAIPGHAPGFDEAVGDRPRLSLVAEVDAHEGRLYFADEDALYFTTLPGPGPDRTPQVQIKRIESAQVCEDRQDLFRRIKRDFDPTLAEVREQWEAATTVAR